MHRTSCYSNGTERRTAVVTYRITLTSLHPIPYREGLLRSGSGYAPKIVLAYAAPTFHLIHGSLGAPESAPPIGISVFGTARGCDQETHTCNWQNPPPQFNSQSLGGDMYRSAI